MDDNRDNGAELLAPKTRNRDARLTASEVSAYMEMHQGPIPKASEFAAYEKVQPGAAHRILRMAEMSLKAEIRYGYFDRSIQLISVLLGKSFLYVLVLTALYLVVNGKPIEALFAGLAPIVASIYASVRKEQAQGRRKRKRR